jgi:rare lipoprotein A
MHSRRTLGLLILTLLLSAACATHKELAQRGEPGFRQQGLASWYGPGFHGKRTANGEVYDMYALTAAHKELPFGTVVEVRNHDNGRTVRVRINDRGPFVRGRIIDLSRSAAERIDLVRTGVAKVTVKVVAGGTRSASSPPGPAGWIIQAGAFRDRNRAEQHLRDVRRVAGSARLDSDGSLHRITIGPFGSEKEARRTLAALERNQIDAIMRRRG